MSITESGVIRKKYRILRLIGEGGMARVWLAEEIAFGSRQVAIKESTSLGLLSLTLTTLNTITCVA